MTTTAPTPAVAIARILRSLGLKQGRGGDFSVTGLYNTVRAGGQRFKERVCTYVVAYSHHAEEVIAAHADTVEQRADASGWSFHVSVRYSSSSGRPITSVSNGPGERVRETPPTSETPAPKPADVPDTAPRTVMAGPVWVEIPEVQTDSEGRPDMGIYGSTLEESGVSIGIVGTRGKTAHFIAANGIAFCGKAVRFVNATSRDKAITSGVAVDGVCRTAQRVQWETYHAERVAALQAWEAEHADTEPPATDTPQTPECRQHGPMAIRTSGQTPQQRACGTWYDCTDPDCRTTALHPSPELRTQLDAQQAQATEPAARSAR